MPDTPDQSGQRYVSLCYHYIRTPAGTDEFPRIMGNTTAQLREHLRVFKSRFQILSLEQVRSIVAGGRVLKNGQTGLLITFDDGLRDHHTAARILSDHGVPGTFFVPTCIVSEREPANPMVIHYGLAIHGIERFLLAWRRALTDTGLDIASLDIPFRRGVSDPWQTIARIKEAAKYRMTIDQARAVLLSIWHSLVVPSLPSAISKVHLSVEQIAEIGGMGHALGTHSHSHVSVATDQLSDFHFEREVIRPKTLLQEVTGVPVYAMSYPFGEARDCLTSASLLKRTRTYDLAFTVEPKLNTHLTSAWELGRYMPWGTESGSQVLAKLEQIISKGTL